MTRFEPVKLFVIAGVLAVAAVYSTRWAAAGAVLILAYPVLRVVALRFVTYDVSSVTPSQWVWFWLVLGFGIVDVMAQLVLSTLSPGASEVWMGELVMLSAVFLIGAVACWSHLRDEVGPRAAVTGVLFLFALLCANFVAIA